MSARHGAVLDAARDGMLTLDGSAGEGGGQILRTALSLSMLTGRPFAIDRIRGGRRKAGLLRQHLTCVRAAAAISRADVDGASLGSERLVFRPGAVQGGEHGFDIGSAGSTCLVAQMLALPLALSREASQVVIRGGTHVPWAPIHAFLSSAFLPLVRGMGAELDLELRSAGFYPAGGGELVLTTLPSELSFPLHIASPGGALSLELVAIVGELPESIARRALAAAAERLGEVPLRLASRSVRSSSPGAAIWIEARDDASGISNVFSGLGERGVPAEEVGRRAAERLLEWRSAGVSVEAFLTDQLLVPIAVAGEGSFTCGPLSLHATTNIEVIEAFTGHRFRVGETGDGKYRVALGGR